MKTILIATDGSPSAQEAAKFGLELAEEQGAQLVFAHVAPALDVLPSGGFGWATAVPHEATEHDMSPLNDVSALAEARGIEQRRPCCAATRLTSSSRMRTRSTPT